MRDNTSPPLSEEEWAVMLTRRWEKLAAAYNVARDEANRLSEVSNVAERHAENLLHELEYLQKYRDALAAVQRQEVTPTVEGLYR